MLEIRIMAKVRTAAPAAQTVREKIR